jgi:hypothetical protein
VCCAQLALCEWGNDAPWSGWGAAIAQVSRTIGLGTGSKLELKLGLFVLMQSYRMTMDHLPFWSFDSKKNGPQGVIDIINAVAAVNNYSVPYGYGDPDFLELGALRSLCSFFLGALFATLYTLQDCQRYQR